MAHPSSAQPSQEKSNALSQDVLNVLDDLNGYHAGFRPVHAKGIAVAGKFRPSVGAAKLTKAPHAQRETTPVTVRFSDFAGFPTVADNNPDHASPRGLAVRFHLAEHIHTDIVGHSADGFPVRTAEEFVEFLRAIRDSGPQSTVQPPPIATFLASHPKARVFVEMPKPLPVSFVEESFFAVTAFRFVAPDGTARFGRFRIRPESGAGKYLTAEQAEAVGTNYLFDELSVRLNKGHARMRITVQLAEPGDVVDDATERWPDSRSEVEFGTLELSAAIPDSDPETKRIIFDPIPRVEGIETSGDPLSDPRADAYLMSGRRRRSAG